MSDTPERIVRELMDFSMSDSVSADEAFKCIGILIDCATEIDCRDGTEHSLKLLEGLFARHLTPEQLTLAHYFSANAWAHLQIASRRDKEARWDWEQSEIEKQLVHLRRASRGEGFDASPDLRRCQILTNYGNLLSHVGRFVDSIENWSRALSIDPTFAMAIGNRGYGLVEYSRALYDEGHQEVFLRQAHVDLARALDLGVDAHATEAFESYKRRIEDHLPADFLRDGRDLASFSLGDTDDEKKYRQWCLDRCLFLNPLNDLGSFAIAARDVFTVPSIIVKTGEGPTYQGFFNQLKQEFVSARFLCFEGLAASHPHFADKEVLLFNTLDYPAYSLHVEKTKIAFRMAYSLLDKIAFFMNKYFQLGGPEHRVTFRTIWYYKEERKRGLKARFQKYKNWPMRGLFWLSKDLFENESGFRNAIEPDAQALNEIRNHAEHKYLKLHDIAPPDDATVASSGLEDRLAYSMERGEFEVKSLRVLKVARAALIYLSLGVHCEEQLRSSERSSDHSSFPMFLDTVDDEWKR